MTLRQILGVLLLALIVIGGAVAWRYAPSPDGPTAPDEPGVRDDQEERPASGADEEFTEELRAMRLAPVDENLRTAAEQMLADHEELGAITVALEEFGRNVTDAISGFLIRQPQTLLRLPSSIEHTGELPIVEMVGV
jgi:hypothetical protein